MPTYENTDCIQEYSAVGMSLEISSELNMLLTKSATRSNRTKRQEALIRLLDHAKRFETISAVGNAQVTIERSQPET